MDVVKDQLIKITILRVVALASFTVLVSDHLMTLPDEIEYIWKKRMTPFSILFLFNRYLAPSTILVYLALNFSFTLLRYCQIESLAVFGPPYILVCVQGPLEHGIAGVTSLLAFTMATMLIAEATITLRVYAVYQSSKLVLCLLLPIYLAHACLMGVMLSQGVLFRDGLDTPTVAFGMEAGILFVAPAVLFDTVAGGLLTLGLYRKSGESRKHMPLVKLIIQDGLLYFAVVFLSNVAWVLVHVFESRGYQFSANAIEFAPLEIWSGCITTTMVGRLTLNLRKYDPAANNELTFQTMTLRFRASRQHVSTTTSHQYSNEGS